MVLAIVSPVREKLLQRLRLFDGLFDAAYHIKRLLRQMIVFAVDDGFEAADRVLERDEFSRRAGEDLGDEKRLRQKALNLPRPRDRKLVLGRELVHAQNGDDVAQLLVALQGLLHASSSRVVLLADDVGIELTRRRIQRVDRGIDAERGDIAPQ